MKYTLHFAGKEFELEIKSKADLASLDDLIANFKLSELPHIRSRLGEKTDKILREALESHHTDLQQQAIDALKQLRNSIKPEDLPQ